MEPMLPENDPAGPLAGEVSGSDRRASVLSARAKMSSLVVGIAGGTGSGKTTVAKTIAAALPSSGVAMIEFDAYYRDQPDLTPEQHALLNFDHPDSLDTELLVEHLGALKEGVGVDVPIYDFKTHRRGAQSRRV